MRLLICEHLQSDSPSVFEIEDFLDFRVSKVEKIRVFHCCLLMLLYLERLEAQKLSNILSVQVKRYELIREANFILTK